MLVCLKNGNVVLGEFSTDLTSVEVVEIKSLDVRESFDESELVGNLAAFVLDGLLRLLEVFWIGALL